MSAQDIKMVKEFNQWRRGGDDVHADDKAYPKRLGDALDAVVATAERAEEMKLEIDRLRHRVLELEGLSSFGIERRELEMRSMVIEDQRRTIQALNALIGGEGSTHDTEKVGKALSITSPAALHEIRAQALEEAASVFAHEHDAWEIAGELREMAAAERAKGIK